MGKRLEMAVAALNGAVGDYLVRTGNGLATEMAFVKDGAPLAMARAALEAAFPEATSRAVVLVPGLMCSENIWQMPGGEDYGTLLGRDLGFTPLYLRYNTGLSIPDNGARLAALLEALVGAWPTALHELLPLGFSMGGLVVRSACHAAKVEGHRWLDLVRRAIYVGTPHLGAPLERIGRVVARVLAAVPDPYTRLAAQLGDMRSEGVKDLGDAHPVPLLDGIRHYLVAGSLSTDPRLAALFGDAMVPMGSGTNGLAQARGTRALPPAHVKVVAGAGHVALAHDRHVYAQIREWCEKEPA